MDGSLQPRRVTTEITFSNFIRLYQYCVTDSDIGTFNGIYHSQSKIQLRVNYKNRIFMRHAIEVVLITVYMDTLIYDISCSDGN